MLLSVGLFCREGVGQAQSLALGDVVLLAIEEEVTKGLLEFLAYLELLLRKSQLELVLVLTVRLSDKAEFLGYECLAALLFTAV